MTLWVIGMLALIGVCVLALLLRKSTLAQSSADADGIDRLTKAGSDLTQVHTIEFLFSFPVRASAEGVSARLHADGYAVFIEAEVTGTRCVLRATRPMIPRLSEMQALRSTLNDLAAREGGLYDGWRAEVVK
ncbi:MAG TPA: ribonuclease E inhibitor RraB [Candidatus Methylomirabilis sp.]|nr:ribonuclease E inhibitor RraB [Candidatus Methylomirabilis sp.]